MSSTAKPVCKRAIELFMFYEARRTIYRYLESAFVDDGLMSPSPERAAGTPIALARLALYQNRKHSIMPGLSVDALFMHDRIVTAKLSTSSPHEPRPAKIPQWQKANTGQRDSVHRMPSVRTCELSLRYSAETTTSQGSSPLQSSTMEADTVITSPESLGGLDLHDEYVHGKDRLIRAQWEFDLRDDTREHEHYWNERDLRRSGGTKGLLREEFDLLRVEHISKLTRALINAEEAFKAARAAAVKGGCHLDDPDAISVFEDEDDEGYPSNREAFWKVNAPTGMIEGWRMSSAAKSDFPDTSAASAEFNSWNGDEVDVKGSGALWLIHHVKKRSNNGRKHVLRRERGPWHDFEWMVPA